MTRMKRAGASRRSEETPARGKGEAERYATAFARVRLVRAWITVVAAILAVLSAYVPLMERVVK